MSTINRLGIDLSGDHFDLYLVGPDGQPLIPAHRFPHNWPGSRAALDYILQAWATQPAEQLAIGGEATGLHCNMVGQQRSDVKRTSSGLEKSLRSCSDRDMLKPFI